MGPREGKPKERNRWGAGVSYLCCTGYVRSCLPCLVSTDPETVSLRSQLVSCTDSIACRYDNGMPHSDIQPNHVGRPGQNYLEGIIHHTYSVVPDCLGYLLRSWLDVVRSRSLGQLTQPPQQLLLDGLLVLCRPGVTTRSKNYRAKAHALLLLYPCIGTSITYITTGIL